MRSPAGLPQAIPTISSRHRLGSRQPDSSSRTAFRRIFRPEWPPIGTRRLGGGRSSARLVRRWWPSAAVRTTSCPASEPTAPPVPPERRPSKSRSRRSDTSLRLFGGSADQSSGSIRSDPPCHQDERAGCLPPTGWSGAGVGDLPAIKVPSDLIEPIHEMSRLRIGRATEC
jgi:hypothetical protein